jgi:uncharacterized protein
VKEFFANHFLHIALFSGIIAQLLKVPIHYVRKKEWDIGLLFSNGGFPSSHTATVVALMTRIGRDIGFGSPFFAISAVFGIIVIFDATGVRQEVGRHSKTLNDILEMLRLREWFNFEILEELVGHTVLEVLAGFVLGIGLAMLSYVWIP